MSSFEALTLEPTAEWLLERDDPVPSRSRDERPAPIKLDGPIFDRWDQRVTKSVNIWGFGSVEGKE